MLLGTSDFTEDRLTFGANEVLDDGEVLRDYDEEVIILILGTSDDAEIRLTLGADDGMMVLMMEKCLEMMMDKY